MYIFKNYVQSIGLLITFLLLLYVVVPFNISFILGYALIALFLFKKEFLLRNMDSDFVLLSIFSITYAAFYSFDPVGGGQFILIYALFPPAFYLMGKYLTRKNTSSNLIFYIILVIGFAFSFSALVSVFINFLQGGFSQMSRHIPMFWTDELTYATKMGIFFTFNMCIPALLIADQGKSKLILRIIASTIFVLSLICVIRIGSRTQLGVIIITCLTAMLYVVPKQSFKKNFALFVVLGVFTTIIYKNVSFDLNADWLTTFAGRLEKGTDDIASGGGRSQRWVKSIENIFKKPLGWGLEEFGYAHNLWFDILRVSGIIPFILLIIFTIRSILSIRKTIKLNQHDLKFNVLILVYGISFFLLFMVEPIFDGVFSMFVIFCLFIGMLNKYYTLQLVKS